METSVSRLCLLAQLGPNTNQQKEEGQMHTPTVGTSSNNRQHRAKGIESIPNIKAMLTSQTLGLAALQTIQSNSRAFTGPPSAQKTARRKGGKSV